MRWFGGRDDDDRSEVSDGEDSSLQFTSIGDSSLQFTSIGDSTVDFDSIHMFRAQSPPEIAAPLVLEKSLSATSCEGLNISTQDTLFTHEEDGMEIDLETHEAIERREAPEECYKEEARSVDKEEVKSVEAEPKQGRRKRILCILLIFLSCVGVVLLGLYLGLWKDDDGRSQSTVAVSTGGEEGGRVSPEVTATEYLLDILSEHTSAVLLLDGNTHQGKAFAALVEVEENASSATSPYQIVQRYALLSLFHATDGRWRTEFGWPTAWINTCSWFGIKSCTRLPNGELAVSKLVLPGNRLKGFIPEEICLLSDSLETLDLSGSSLSGPIPSCLGRFRKLVDLNLSENQLTGSLPAGLLTIPTLMHVDVHDNDLSGTLDALFDPLEGFPASASSAATLVTFNVEQNQFTGEIPVEFSEPTALLQFGNNNFFGTVLSSVCVDSIVIVDCTRVTCLCCDGCRWSL